MFRSIRTLRQVGLASLVAVGLALTARAAAGGDHPVELDAHRAPQLRTGGSCLISNVTIHSAVGPAAVGSVLVRDGKIAAVGDVSAPTGVTEIDGTGMHLAPGVVDCHSHIAVDGSVNEGTLSITCDVDISDVIDADDPAIYRALAGGVTTIRILHGSANTIGGRHEVIKLRFGRSAAELVFPDAPEGVKFALGENPKRSRGRFPNTRMGVESIFDRAFTRANEYMAEWRVYEDAKSRGEDPAPPRKDVRLEALSGIVRGDIDVHSHCYRADEILMLLRACERYGIRIKTLQHVLEGYKVAHEMAEHGAGGSTFGDWWAYKIEAYDAIPTNAALMDEAGVLSSVNSDSAEMMRRLYGEAAKSVRYAGMDRVRALGLVTLFPAQQLGIGDRVGSIEVGKDADLVLLNGDPLSSLARVEWTMVDGEVEFQRRDAFGLDDEPPGVREAPSVAVEAAAWRPNGGETIALVGGTIHTVSGSDIEGGTLLMQDGRIVGVGADLPIPAESRVIDVSGRDVWPGIIALNTNLGLHEIGAVEMTSDESETGGNQPDVRTSAAINAESAHIPVTRYNGVTRAQSAPQGGGPLMGQSCVIRTVGDTWEELLHVDRDMLHVRFPRTRNDADEKDKKKDSEAVEELAEAFEEAREYARLAAESATHGVPAPPYDPRLAALAPYATGDKPVAIHADNAQTILHALEFVRENGLDATLFGATEGWKVVEPLAASGLSVVVGPVLTLPSTRYDPYDAPYANAAVLARAGVPIAIQSADTENPRNVAFHAAMAAAHGLPRAEAVRAVTLHAARALGLEDRLGSLEEGKIADVIVTDGDLLEISSPVEYVFVDGRQASLETRQTRFYDKYRERLLRLQAAK